MIRRGMADEIYSRDDVIELARRYEIPIRDIIIDHSSQRALSTREQGTQTIEQGTQIMEQAPKAQPKKGKGPYKGRFRGGGFGSINESVFHDKKFENTSENGFIKDESRSIDESIFDDIDKSVFNGRIHGSSSESSESRNKSEPKIQSETECFVGEPPLSNDSNWNNSPLNPWEPSITTGIVVSIFVGFMWLRNKKGTWINKTFPDQSQETFEIQNEILQEFKAFNQKMDKLEQKLNKLEQKFNQSNK